MARKKDGPAGKEKAKRSRRKDPTAAAAGAATGLLVIAWACLKLVQGQSTLLDTAKLALVGLVSAIVVEKVVFPLGRTLVGPPQQTKNGGKEGPGT